MKKKLYDGGPHALSCGVVPEVDAEELPVRLEQSQKRLGMSLLTALTTGNSAALSEYVRGLGLKSNAYQSDFEPADHRFED